MWLQLLWVFGFGACFGSFMNVVIYRVPARLNLAWPGSHCPRCGHAIRAFDNVPVLAWLWLRGRCRDCRATIPLRYPLVEALVGMLFVAVVLGEIHTHGEYLPRRAAAAFELLSDSQQLRSLWLTAVAHIWVLCVLVCVAFIQFDGKGAPITFWLIALGVALAFGAAPFVQRPIPVAAGITHEWLVPLFGVLAGLALGGLAGPLVARGLPAPVLNTAGAAGCCGAVLGWQAAVLLVPLATLVWALDGGLGRALRIPARLPWTAYLALITLLLMLQWRLVDAYLAFPV